MNNPTQRANSLPSQAPSPRSGAGLLWCIRLFAIVAFGICAYLAWQSASGALPVGCGPESDCDQLLAGSWAKWFDIPVSFPAAAVYLGIFLASFGASPSGTPARRRGSWAILTILSLMTAAAGIWFIVLQTAIVHKICPFCMTVHGCGILIGLIVLLGLRTLPTKRKDANTYRIVPGIRPNRIWALMLAALAGVGVLIAGQALSSPPQIALSVGGGDEQPRHRSTRPTQPTTLDFATTHPLPTPLTTQATTQPDITPTKPAQITLGPSDFQIGDEIVPIDATELPCIGSPNAPNRIAVLGDYTCPVCRGIHPWLFDASKRYGDQLVIILLPMALDAKYVHRLQATPPQHVNALALAKIAMAVFRADPNSFSKMDAWLYEGPTRTPEAARDYAAKLVGADQFAKAQADTWVERTVLRDIRLYVESGGGDIPKLLLQKGAAKTKLSTKKAFFEYLEKELHLKPPATGTDAQ